MFVMNPPAVPAHVPVTSKDPAIAAVEWACIQAGVRYQVLDTPVITSIGPDNDVGMKHIELLDLGLHIDVESHTNAVVRERYMRGKMIVDGADGIDNLVAFLSELKPKKAP